VVDPHHRAEDLAGLVVLGHQHGQRAAVAARPEEVGRHGHHPALGVDRVDRLGVGARVVSRRMKKPCRRARATRIGRQVEPVGVRRVEEQLLRRRGQQHMRVAHVEGDVAPVRPLGAQRLGQPSALSKVWRRSAAPAAVDQRIGSAPRGRR
jgi:hypothetical protein